MTVAKELDDWTTELQAALSIHATRDPDKIFPPCVFVGLPPHVLSPIAGGGILDLPVYVLAGGSGKQQGDELLNMLPHVLAVTGQTEAETATMTTGDITYSGYLITVPVRLTPVTPVAPSQPGQPVLVDIKPAGPGMYSCGVTWTPPTDEGSSPITHYEVTIDGETKITNDDSTLYSGILIPAATEWTVYVVAVNSETKSIPSDTSTLSTPPSE